ncbi:substrate-binding domain-containing protein [Rathayibacter sp. ZW T2_19]|uniref:Substrate-binding domain-containing protein n=1 Tax=Rathayibacter rubneri TaxID=2950106 RepID=A0A9X2IVG8_9MICO|nr:substrate-binding domain-containing protein [Rathayibacter rubneri]MCM6764518.1 substrate-binding domain-containing protein [Rathayibacter rubneri]
MPGDASSRARPSMADVGRRAEVSAQTVSRFFTGGYVAPATRERIESAIAALGYRHNRVARNLRVQSTDTIGFLAMGPLNYGNAELLTGVSRAARATGLSLITALLDTDPGVPSSPEEVRHAVDKLLSFQVDGIIVGTPYEGLDELLDYIATSVPVVTRSEHDNASVDSTSADSFGAGYLGTRHLLELGHRRILHLAGPRDRNEAVERERGYRAALEEAGVPALEVLRCREWDAGSGAEHARMVDPESFTAVSAANDQIALGFLQTMAERGRIAPDDYSIVGVDDMPDSEYFSPPLTTMHLDHQALGETALRMLAERIRTGERQQRTSVSARLVVRRSTGRLADTSLVEQPRPLLIE